MKVSLETRNPLEAQADVLLIGKHTEEARPAPALQEIDSALRGQLSRVLTAEKFEGKPGQVAYLYGGPGIRAERIAVVGLGARKDYGGDAVRRAAAAGVRRARDLGARSVVVALPAADGVSTRGRAHAVVEGAVLGTYRFDRYLRDKSEKVVESLSVIETDRRSHGAAREGLVLGELTAAAVCAARDLVNEPANVVTPTYLAERAAEIARAGKLQISILEREDCEKLGMGAYLGVARGSQEPPKFIHLRYAPGRRARKRVVVIGKGVTFDSGGLDLKSADGMLRMKNDMSGAAAVLAVFHVLPRLHLPVEVHGLIAATENMPSGTAQRPGDIVRAMNGLTVEIGNTDAEGRLTLADALAYAAREIKPDEMVDLATLTGAVVIALGQQITGVMGSADSAVNRILAAAEEAGERMWRLPLHDEYKEGLKSDIADLNNVSSQRGAGSIMGALFMREFTGGVPWVHLDIAGTAFSEREWGLGPKGATGVGVRTLVTYLRKLAGHPAGRR
jgi:leucyl aminopeptidase